MPATMPSVDDIAPEPRFLSVEPFSRTLGVSRSTGYTLLDSGQVRSVRWNGRRLIPVEELDLGHPRPEAIPCQRPRRRNRAGRHHPDVVRVRGRGRFAYKPSTGATRR